ncbi:unnamed protein product [Adineta steineri]|uniref:Uncharacterized protein n=1 Tax=Adineta steineri TaxID=433720 RepID=A0A819EZN1_9BILA|nr:unnamed protein product [Adineta steineri]CAF3858915.1 unnamed protein product [Adineta steineri]
MKFDLHHVYSSTNLIPEQKGGQLSDEDYSRIPKSRLRLLINYAVHDLLTVSYLVNPVMEKWSYKEFSEASMTFLLTDTSSSTSTHTTTSFKIDKIKKNINDNTFKNVLNFLESISDDELNGNEGDNVNGYGEGSAGVNDSGENLIIALSNDEQRREAGRTLSSNIFSKNSYYYYGKKFR